MLAHIVGGGPVWPLWLTGTVLFGGAVAAMVVPHTLRRACLGVSGVGLVATVVVYALLPSAPTAPRDVSSTVSAPSAAASVNSPVVVRVCGGSAIVPGANQLLSLSVDGHQVAEVKSNTAAVNVNAGQHTLRVELLTAQHIEYAPPVLTEETITVSGIGPLAQPPDRAPPSASTP